MMRKKYNAFLTSLLLLLVLLFNNTAEASGININYWYSDSIYVGVWEDDVPVVYAKKLNYNGSFAFLNALSIGREQWSEALGTTVSYSYQSSYENSDIRFQQQQLSFFILECLNGSGNFIPLKAISQMLAILLLIKEKQGFMNLDTH